MGDEQKPTSGKRIRLIVSALLRARLAASCESCPQELPVFAFPVANCFDLVVNLLVILTVLACVQLCRLSSTTSPQPS